MKARYRTFAGATVKRPVPGVPCRAPIGYPARLSNSAALMKRQIPKNAFYAQSGGVTAVINASACGVIETARKHGTRSARYMPAATASSARSPRT